MVLKNIRSQTKQKAFLSVGFLFVLAITVHNLGAYVRAASLTSTNIRFNRMKAATATTFRLTFTVPAGNTLTEAELRVGFPDAYTIATTNLITVVASCGATGLPGTHTVTGNNTNGQKNILITGVTNLTASTTYCVDIDRTTTNDPVTNAAAGQYTISIATRTSGQANIDTASLGARVIGDDQIVVSAVVPPSFNFVLDGNTTSFTADLDPGAVGQTTARTVTITSNAPQGWIAWAKDSNTGLTSAAAGKTIASTTPGTGATLSSGTEGYVLGVEATDAGGGGTVTVVPAYAGTGADANGSGLDTTFRQIGSANGTANGDVLTLRGKAAINGFTPAAVDYTDTWTVIGAGSY